MHLLYECRQYNLRQHIVKSTRIDGLSTKFIEKTFYDGVGDTYQSVYTGSFNRQIQVHHEKDTVNRVSRISNPSFDILLNEPAAGVVPENGWNQQFTYTDVGPLKSVTYKNGTSTTYASANNDLPLASAISTYNLNFPNSIVSTNTLGEKTRKIYNMKGQLVALIDATDNPTFYEYDPLGNLIRVWNESDELYRAEYDSLSRLIYKEDADRGIDRYEYDLVGNVLRYTNANNSVTEWLYDALDRVYFKSRPGQRGAITFKYDDQAVINGLGRLSSISYNFDYASYKINAYDQMGQVKDVSWNFFQFANKTYNLKYNYDYTGKLTSTILPNGKVIANNFDAAGNLDSIALDQDTVATWGAAYDAFGRPGSRNSTSGLSVDYTYDPNWYGIKSILGAGRFERHYDYNQIGLLSGGLQSPINGYDKLHRLLSSDIPNVAGTYDTYSYGYNVNHNIDFKDQLTLAYTVGHRVDTANKVDGSGYAFTYDFAGNQTSRTTTNAAGVVTSLLTTTYSANNQSLVHLVHTIKNFNLVSGNLTAAHLFEHYYDIGGQRYQTTHTNLDGSGDVLVSYFITPQFEVLYDTVTGLTQNQIHIYGNGNKVATYVSPWEDANGLVTAHNKGDPVGYKYYYHDVRGSTIFVTDEFGNELSQLDYLPFGSVDASKTTDSLAMDNTFTGKKFNDITGLYYSGARYYDPAVGMFTSTDPIIPNFESPLAFNAYTYSYNNPVNLVDPTGFIPEPIDDWGRAPWEMTDDDWERENDRRNDENDYEDYREAMEIPSLESMVLPDVEGLTVASLFDMSNDELLEAFRKLHKKRKAKNGVALKIIDILKECKNCDSYEKRLQFVKQSWNFSKNNFVKMTSDIAHNVLDPNTKKFKTTAIGIFDDGSLGISSSDKSVPKPQRLWAEKNNIKVFNGVGHAEEGLINAGAKHVDASRGVCLDCEGMMQSKGVTTNTHFTGKRSRRRR